MSARSRFIRDPQRFFNEKFFVSAHFTLSKQQLYLNLPPETTEKRRKKIGKKRIRKWKQTKTHKTPNQFKQTTEKNTEKISQKHVKKNSRKKKLYIFFSLIIIVKKNSFLPFRVFFTGAYKEHKAYSVLGRIFQITKRLCQQKPDSLFYECCLYTTIGS